MKGFKINMMDRKNLMTSVLGNIKRVQSATASKTSSNSQKDETYWNAPWDDTKKLGNAVIAFLPFADIFTNKEDGEVSPYVAMHVHNKMVNSTGKKYFNIMCPSAFPGSTQSDCPICNEFFAIWNKSEEGKEIVKKLALARKRQYCGNIIVLKNEKNPEDVGKVFKWKYGMTIQEKIANKINPTDAEDTPIIVHNIYNILPFKLKLIEKNKYRNLDNSEFMQSNSKSLADYLMPNVSKATEEEKDAWMETNVIDKLYKVEDFVKEDMFKSKEELTNILNEVLSANNMDPSFCDKSDGEEKIATKTQSIRDEINKKSKDTKSSDKELGKELESIINDDSDDALTDLTDSFETETDIDTELEPELSESKSEKKDDFDIDSMFAE